PEAVILGVIPENYNRLMNVFRDFYTYPFRDQGFGFKPMLVETGAGGYVWRNFLPKSAPTREALESALRQAAEIDPYFPARVHDRSRFPRSFSVIELLLAHGLTLEPF